MPKDKNFKRGGGTYGGFIAEPYKTRCTCNRELSDYWRKLRRSTNSKGFKALVERKNKKENAMRDRPDYNRCRQKEAKIRNTRAASRTRQ